MTYSKRIKDLRTDADRTQAEIADLLNTSQQYYGKYENGKRPLPIEHLKTLCEYYHVNADYILGLPAGLPYGHSRTLRNNQK